MDLRTTAGSCRFDGGGVVRNRLPRYLAERGMSRERYMALMWTCRGYDQMRRRLETMRDPLQPARYGVNAGGGVWPGDPTGAAVVRVTESVEGRVVGAIERAAREVAGEDWRQVILCVCRGVGYEMQSPRPRCGERVFRTRVWEFFARLDQIV